MDTTGLTCSNCNRVNQAGALICDQCGRPLFVSTLATKRMDNPESAPQTKTWGTAKFGTTATLALHINGYPSPLTIPLVQDSIVTLGRKGDETGSPTIDLTDYGAGELGVSRRHAHVSRVSNVLLVTDLSSTNGTYVNGTRLAANSPMALRDGDEIRLGHMVAKAYFS